MTYGPHYMDLTDTANISRMELIYANPSLSFLLLLFRLFLATSHVN